MICHNEATLNLASLSILSFLSPGNVPEAARIPLAMLIVFGSAKILAEFFEALGQPGIVGEILAGVVVGPSLLNWVQPRPSTTDLSTSSL